MSVLLWVASGGAGVALINAAVAARNLLRYARAPEISSDDSRSDRGPARHIAVCIPARNEAANIENCVCSALAGITDQDAASVLVHDDGSTDGTNEIVGQLASEDSRIVLVQSDALPAGWNGKQHGCWRLASLAIERGATHLLFTDADVRLEPHGVSRAATAFDQINSKRQTAGAPQLGLLSAFPKQITRSLGESLQVPMMFFILMSYLPMGRMRTTTDPASSAACGQFILMPADVYTQTRGHELVRASMHEGVRLPREIRKQGYGTDLIDGTDLARVRMYEGFAESWRGFAKNAFEGIGNVGLLLFLTVLNLLGHVVPALLLLVGLLQISLGNLSPGTAWVLAALGGVLIAVASRIWIALRLQNSIAGALLHPVGVCLMVAVQWWSYVLQKRGKRVWRGRIAPGAVA